MKKEVIIAIVLGLSVGLVIAVGVIRARQTLKADPASKTVDVQSNPTPLINTQNVLSSPTSVGISLFTPQDEEVLTKKQLTVSGQTYPESFVSIVVNKRSYYSEADKDGHFSSVISLDFGGNQISVQSLDPDGKEGQTERLVTFYDKMLEEEVLEPSVLPSPSASASAKPSGKKSSPKPTATP